MNLTTKKSTTLPTLCSLSKRELIAALKAQAYEIGYHGSGAKFERFTPDKVGQGGDANSSLGVCLTNTLSTAIEYSELSDNDEAYIYVVASPCKKPYVNMSSDEFFGLDDEGHPTVPHAHFAQRRIDLLSAGHDCVWFEGSDEGISVVLKADEAQIIACLTVDEAEMVLTDEQDPLDVIDALSAAGYLIDEKTVKPSRRLGNASDFGYSV